MKIIDNTPATKSENFFIKTIGSLQEMISPNLDEGAQDIFIAHLNRLLSNKFVLLRNSSAEGLEIPIPLILVGPPGVYVVYASGIKGVFQAKNEAFGVIHGSQVEPAKPNLITRTLLMTKAVQTYLEKKGHPITEIQGLLFFSNPGTHVDSVRPAVRVVLVDGLDRLASSIAQGTPCLSRENVDAILAAFKAPAPDEIEYRFDEEAPAAPARPVEKPVEPILGKKLTEASKKIPITRSQWIFLGIMAGLEILILLGIIILVLVTS